MQIQTQFRSAEDAWPISRGVGLITGIALAVGLWATVLGAVAALAGIIS